MFYLSFSFESSAVMRDGGARSVLTVFSAMTDGVEIVVYCNASLMFHRLFINQSVKHYK